MKDLFRNIVFLTLCGVCAVVVIQILVDLTDIMFEVREERRRAEHPSHGRPRYE